ncbi:hypothetical protein M409DRAFT_22239 [Zasmidium cellare ATCC 36951]|uniref:F-box domain-containing protein n=1 Tax=Zasmidium cellare ATCC 36951 TaxID=1080233 RepID=A0A6A6CMP9_ZASCE|nr:uncharacterized protein M409DRAFT_22239 [Zasmidium cellare ATCC 36951]KAF2167430.1 hypothetical protein M409DRAFT_22239 [Zasmidium cellare ATCC 36951]
MAAIGKAFGTTELLESILNHLPISDLWKAQHINKGTRAIIRGSHRLASRLFAALLPAGDIPPLGSSYAFFNDAFFDIRLTSQHQSHFWRRKLNVSRRNTSKPEGKISRIISKCYNTAIFLRHNRFGGTIFFLVQDKSTVTDEHWRSRWDYAMYATPRKCDEVEVCYLE